MLALPDHHPPLQPAVTHIFSHGLRIQEARWKNFRFASSLPSRAWAPPVHMATGGHGFSTRASFLLRPDHHTVMHKLLPGATGKGARGYPGTILHPLSALIQNKASPGPNYHSLRYAFPCENSHLAVFAIKAELQALILIDQEEWLLWGIRRMLFRAETHLPADTITAAHQLAGDLE